MVIGVLVLGAVGFAVAFQAPPPPSATAGSQNLAQETWDAVDALNKMHYPDASFGNSTLSRVVADAAAGDKEPLVDSLSGFMPDGSEFQVYLNNGYDRFPLYTNKTPAGQTAAIAYPFEPNWKHHYAATDLRVYKNGSDTAMGTTLIPLFNSHHVQDEGQNLRARVDGMQDQLPGQDLKTSGQDLSFTEDSYSTLLQGDDTVSYPSAEIHMQCERTNGTVQPCYAIDLTGSATEGYAAMETTTQSGDELKYAEDGTTVTWHRLDFEIHNRGPGTVTENTTLTLNFPVGLQVAENASAVHDRLKDIRYLGTYPDTQTVKATLNGTEIPSDQSAELQVWVRVDDSRYAYKTIDAYLEGGAVSSSQFLAIVNDKSSGTFTGGDTRKVLVSTPKPAGAVSGSNLPTGRWGVVMPVPSTRQAIHNITLTLTEQGGEFADVRYPTDWIPEWPNEASGGDTDLSSYSFGSEDADNPPTEDSTLKVTATDIEWGTNGSDDHIYPAYTFVEIQFVVTTDGQLTEASPEFPFARPRAEFRDFLPPGQSNQVEPGIWWSEYPPETGGETSATYDDLPGYGAGPGNPDDGTPLVERTFDSVITHRNSKIAGEEIYREADLTSAQGAVKDAVHASRLTVTPQTLAPGETAQLTLDSQDLASYISSTVGLQHMNLTTYIYAPWGIPDERPVKKYVHASGTGPLNAPNDLMAGWLNADNAQDVVVASSDGNVYGVSGDNGNTIATKIFEVPQGGTGDETAEPTILERAFAPGEGQFYAVGTDNSISNWYTFDEDFDQRWKAQKPGGSVKTLGINTSRDLDGDNVPDLVVSQATADATETASLITVWSGADQDGDGEGDLLPGWDPEVNSNKTVPGSATQLGMGNVGAEASPGVYMNTGFQVSAETEYNLNTEDPDTEDLDENVNLSLAWSISKTGMVGYYEDARRAWNYSGGEFVDLTTTERLDTDKWSGILATDRQGWMYGFNASQPLPPVTGSDFVAYDRMTDIAMANPLEAYVASPDGGLMLATDDGWGSYLGSTGVVSEADEPPVHAVDTPDGPYLEGYGNVSWWAGDAGTLLRSTDRLDTVRGLTTTGQLVASIELDSSTDDLTESVLGLSTDTIDLTNVNFRDVLAESRDEAWFVGHGISGTTLDQHGYIVHTEDGGETMDVFEIECIDDGTTLDNCGVTSIGRSGGDIWIAGENGMVLVQDRSGSATNVTLEGSPGFEDLNGYGNLVLNLTASSPSAIKNVTVDWKPDTDLDWMRGVRLRDGLPDLWNVSEECCHDGTLSTGNGVSDGTTVFVDEYVNLDTTPETDATRTVDGGFQLLTGPFKQTLLPASGYFAASHYDSLETNFTVNVTFDDGSQDVYLVDLHDDGTWDVEELASAGWTMPSQVGYQVPDTCFGQPESQCTTYYGLNFTQTTEGTTGAIVGVPQGNWSSSHGQAPIVRLGPGSSTFEPLWNVSVNQTFRDVGINPANGSRWLVAGDGGRVIASWDTGQSWIDLQAPQDLSDNAMAVDYTHPEVAEIVGENQANDGHAFKWTLGGYREYGRTETVDLPRTASSETGPLEKVAINTSYIDVSDLVYGINNVKIEIWDGGYEGWSTVYVPSGSDVGWKNHSSDTELSTYEYSAPTEEVKLRFTLFTSKAASRWSSQVHGNMTVLGYTDASSDSNATIMFDLADASKFQDLGQLNHSAEHGYLRLPSVDIPWVLKLGNTEAGPWNDTKSRFTAPRIHDADVSPDGEVAFVGTGGIYDYTTDTQVSHNGSPAYDNSLYRVKVAGGTIDWSWGPVRFDEPIHEVRVGDEAVYVFTREDTATSAIGKVTRISLSDPTVTHNTSILSTRSLKSMEIVDAFPDNNNVGDDIVLSLKDENTNDGLLQAHQAPTVTLGWVSRPSLKGSFDFDYDIPRSAMFGTNVVVTEITWNVTDEYGQDILQTARVHNSFAITPPNGRMPLSPSYNLEVVAWMEDWG